MLSLGASLTCFVFGVTLLVAWDIYRKRRIFKFASQIAGFRFYPIIGNCHHCIGKDVFGTMLKVANTHKLPCNFWAGHIYIYATSDPDEIKVILNHPNTTEKAVTYKNFEFYLGNTIILQPHEEWKGKRKIFAKGFNQRALNKQVGLFYKKSCSLVGDLKTSSKELPLEVFHEFTMSILTDSFSEQDPLTPKEIRSMSYNTIKFQEIFGKRFVSLCPDFIYYLTPEGRLVMKCLDNIKTVVAKIIRNKRKRLNETKGSDSNQEDLPLIDQMMRADTQLTDQEIQQQLLLFIMAAIETSATTLLFTLTLIGMHREVQEKLYQEVIDTVGRSNPITHNDLPNLKYTEMAISESMRLLPVVPIIGRYVSGDVDLGTRVVPAGSNVHISIFHVHRDERYWKNPLVFDPDRFLPDEVAKRHPYAFIPFSDGPRNCIGKKNATMLIKTAVANIVRNYEIHSNYKSVDDIQLSSAITLHPTHNLECTFVPRL